MVPSAIQKSQLTPQLDHELVNIDAELGGIKFSKLFDGKGPSMEAGAEPDRAVGRVDANDAHGAVVVSVGGDDHVDVLDNPDEVNEVKLELKVFHEFYI